MRTASSARMATYHDISEAWQLVCASTAEDAGRGFTNTSLTTSLIRLNRSQIVLVANILEFPLSEEELDACLAASSTSARADGVGTVTERRENDEPTISLQDFDDWWNGDQLNPNLDSFKESMNLGKKIEGGGAIFG